MLSVINKETWKSSYKEDFLDKIHALELALKSNDLYKSEYWYVITLTDSLYIIKQYLCLNDEMYCKPKSVIENAVKNGIIQEEQEWLESVNLSNRIGRAVRPKEENIPFIKSFVKNFYDLIDYFDRIMEKQ